MLFISQTCFSVLEADWVTTSEIQVTISNRVLIIPYQQYMNLDASSENMPLFCYRELELVEKYKNDQEEK
jgi:hypothetical protein